MVPRQTLFHKPSATNNIFPKGWKTGQAQDAYIRFLTPYYTVASKAGARKQFLERVYPIWFDRFPVTIKSDSEDLEELQWAITRQEKVREITLNQRR